MTRTGPWLQFGVLAAALVSTSSTLAAPAQQPAPSADKVEITLLGTAGGPPPHLDSSQPATLLKVNTSSYLIDAGENAGQQLQRAGGSSSKITAAFITHLHWDHTLGLGYLMATGWMTGRTTPLPVFGPPGLAEYVSREISALGVGEDIFRAQTPHLMPLASLYPTHEVDLTSPREIYRDGDVRVTAVANTHYGAGEPTKRNYGSDRSYSYRFDMAKGSVTFTGDTGPSDAVAELAKGSDVLVSEVCDVKGIRAALEQTMGKANIGPLMDHMEHEHLSPAEVGKLASKAGVKKLVLTHFVTGRNFDAAKIVAEIRQFYPTGEIVVGHDLDVVNLGN